MPVNENLSASATSFVPGGGGSAVPPPPAGAAASSFHSMPASSAHEYDQVTEDLIAEMESNDMDDLVATMENTTVSTPQQYSNTSSSSSLPAHLAAHASEFWFPECRDCACCKGYKHGCRCGGLCHCCGGGTPVSVAKPAAASTSLSTAAASTSASTTRHPRAQHQSGASSSGETNKKQPACRFFAAGKCKFGDSCRFSHVA